MNSRLTFLSHFCICLACAGASFFAWRAGVPQAVWANEDARWFGMAVAAVVVSTVVKLGHSAWQADCILAGDFKEEQWPHIDVDFGHTAEKICPSIGMLGTVVGLILTFRSGGDTIEVIRHAATAFYSTGCGLVGMIVVMLMTHSLEAGKERAWR